MTPEENRSPAERLASHPPDTRAAAAPQTMAGASPPAGTSPNSTPERTLAAGRDAYATQAHTPSEPEAGLRYRPLRPHARGGLGEVLVAYDEELNREVALKQIQDRFADDDVSRSRFVLEAEITGGLEHPGIVPVYGLGTYADGRPYYAMRFIRGMSLSDAVDEFYGPGATRNAGQRALEFHKLLARLVSVCQALEYAHSRGVVHRDIKPGNIMLGKFGETLVVDWGLAKLVGRPDMHHALDERPLASQSIAASMPTVMGTALGTPQFMSPEQALGRLDLIDATSDVYSLGATLYYVLTGRSPFAEGDVSVILQRVQRGQFPPPRSVHKAVPAELEAICLKAMAREHTERYASAGALADDLEHWLADEPVSALPDSPLRRIARWARHHRAWALSGVAALLLVTVASTVAMFFVEGERRRADENAAAAIDARQKEEEARRHAERQARIANASRLASQSSEALRSLPQLSLLLAVESLKATSDHDELPLAESRQALVDALAVVGGQPLVGHKAALQTIVLSHDGRWAASGDEDGEVCLWDLGQTTTPEPIVLSGHKGPVWTIAFSRDGHWLATAGGDRQVRLWKLTAAQPASQSLVLAGHTGAINALAFSADSKFLATVSKDKTARLWSLADGKPADSPRVLGGHAGDVDVLAFSDDGHWLATAGSDETVRLWAVDADDPAASPQVLPSGDAVLALAISPDSQWLVAAGGDGTAHVWQLTADNIAESALALSGHEDAINALAISGNSRRLFTGSYDGTIRIWSLGGSTATSSQTLRGHDAGIFCLAVSASGRWLASGSADKTARLWDLESADPGATAVVLRGHERTLLALALRDDGQFLVTAARDTAPRVWDFAGHEAAAMPTVLRGHTRTVLDLQASGDGRWLAAASADRTTSLWDVRSANLPAERIVLGGHSAAVWRAAFDPTGRWLATVSHDATARLWDLQQVDKRIEQSRADRAEREQPPSAQKLESSAELRGHEGPIWTAIFTADGRRLATGGADHTARLWDTAARDPGAAPVVLRGHEGEVVALARSRDGRWLFTGSKDKTVRRWDLRASDPEQNSLVYHGHESEIGQVAVSPDGRWLLAAGHHSVVHVWPISDASVESPRKLSAHRGDVLAAGFSPDGKWLVSAGADSLVCLWKMGENGPSEEPLRIGHDGAVTSLAFSKDGHWLVTGSFDRTSMLCDLTAAQPTSEPLVLQGLASEVITLALTPDARYLATAGADHAVRLWDLRLEKLIELARRTAGRELSEEERAKFRIEVNSATFSRSSAEQ